MSTIRIISIAALASGIWCLTASLANGQTTSTGQPNPPSQICVNNQCVTTTLPNGNPVSSKGSIKWNPGHYMASEAVLGGGKTISYVQAEMDDLNHQDAILGYRAWFTWGALEKTQGTYDFTVVDAILARLKTAYNKPKRLVIGLWLYGQHPLGPHDSGGTIPLYIQQDQKYGASPVTGSYGWWGQNSNGASTGMYAAALYNPPVMDRLIALVQALGKHLDGDPYFEAIVLQEDAGIAEAASGFGSPDPNYSDATWLAQLQRFLAAATTAFPHTSVVMHNSWFDRPPSGVTLEQWMATNRIAPGSPDSWGQSSITTYGTSHLSDGIQTLLGVSPYGGSADLRPKMRAMMEVQTPDLVGSYFSQYGGPWTAIDLIQAFNQTYHASHVFWTHMFGTEASLGAPVPAASKWSNLAATCAANPLTHTEYPGNYP
jgi:hypothetical protein